MNEMTDALKLFLLSCLVFAFAYAPEQFFVPEVVTPISDAVEPQPVWQVEVAFLLEPTEAVAAMVAALAVWLEVAPRIDRYMRFQSQRTEN